MNAISFRATANLNNSIKSQPNAVNTCPQFKEPEDKVSFGSKLKAESLAPKTTKSIMPTIMFLVATGTAIIGGAIGVGKDVHNKHERIDHNAAIAMAQAKKDHPKETVIKDVNDDGVGEVTYMKSNGDTITFDLNNNVKTTKHAFDDEYKEPISDLGDVKTDYKTPNTMR